MKSLASLTLALTACQAASIEVLDNPTLALEKTLLVTARAPTAVTLECTLEGDPDERHRLRRPAATEHALVLRGLLPAATYRCDLDLHDGGAPAVITLDTDQLPAGVPAPALAATDGARRGYTLINYASAAGGDAALLILDDEARVRWYYQLDAEFDLDAQYIGGDCLHYGGGHIPPTLIDLSHEVLAVGPAAGDGVRHHHHAERRDGETMALITAKDSLDGREWAGFVAEIRDAASGALRWSWASQEAVEAGHLTAPPPVRHDPWHANWIDARGDDFYVNFRNSDEVLRVDQRTGEIIWRLGNGGDFALLDEDGQPAGDARWFYGAHGPELDGDRVLLYDNGGQRPVGEYSRAVELTLDEDARTAQITWEYTEPGWYEPIWGDVDYHGDDRFIITRAHCSFCETPSRERSAVFEVDRASGEVVWALTFLSEEDATYRSQRVDGCAIFDNQKYCSP